MPANIRSRGEGEIRNANRGKFHIWLQMMKTLWVLPSIVIGFPGPLAMNRQRS